MDGLSKVSQITKRLDVIGTDCCALTDHGNLGGHIAFLNGMLKAGKKPILGCELYVSSLDAKIKDETNRSLSHLLVYAKNTDGWRELIQLTSQANRLENFYYRPRLSLKQLASFASPNLMWVSGHLGSTIASALIEDDKITDLKHATTMAEWMRDIFGESNFYLEAQLISKDAVPLMKPLTDAVREISKKTGIPVVATPDAHYANREDAVDQRILLCRNLGSKTLDDARKSNIMSCFFNSDSFHIPSYDEMIEAGHTEEELENTNLFAASIEDYEGILQPPQLPNFPCPTGYDADEWLRQLCRDGWAKKVQDIVPVDKHPEYVERVKYELGVLQGAGLSSYFLIVRDIVKYIEANGWLPGPGRGSAAGCLVSYLTDITQIDPIPYGLIFARFYNQGRNTADHISMPDIDLDVPTNRRDDIIEYIKTTYGEEYVSQMVTYQTMQGRGALKDVFRAHGMSFDEMNSITKHIPDKARIAEELQQMKEDRGESSIIRWTLENDDSGHLKQWCHVEDDVLKGPYAKLFEQAIRLEGTKTSQSRHPAGVVIAPKPMDQMCPMVLDKKTKKPIAGLEMDNLESVGCIKFDVLGVSVLNKLMGISSILETGDVR